MQGPQILFACAACLRHRACSNPAPQDDHCASRAALRSGRVCSKHCTVLFCAAAAAAAQVCLSRPEAPSALHPLVSTAPGSCVPHPAAANLCSSRCLAVQHTSGCIFCFKQQQQQQCVCCRDVLSYVHPPCDRCRQHSGTQQLAAAAGNGSNPFAGQLIRSSSRT